MSEIAKKSSFTRTSSSKQSVNKIHIGINHRLTLNDVQLLAQQNIPIFVSQESQPRMLRSYAFLKSAIEKRIPVYGINTNFGDQVNLIDPYVKGTSKNTSRYFKNINERQQDVLRSHSCGLGEVVSENIVKVTMMLRAHCLAQGYSGVSTETVEALLNFLNNDIIPVVRRYGSIGASGDLIPLAMIGNAIANENVDVFYQGKLLKAPLAIKKAGIKKFKPQLRDGLALINGTSFMTAIASLALYQLNRLFSQLLCTIAMSLEALLVIDSAYQPIVHQLKGHEGQQSINEFLISFWTGSKLIQNLENVRSHQLSSNHSKPFLGMEKPLQDYYSLRSVAQGFGPFYENLDRAKIWVENEMNSVNDNPIVDSEAEYIHHSANFMGYYITDTCDILKIDIAQASTWVHALLANLLHPRKNFGLPVNLVENSYSSGFRPLQLLAASLAVQNRKIAQNHQAFMLPTEGDNQDVNSLGTHAAFDLQQAVANLEKLTAILLIAAVQALEYRGIDNASFRAQAIVQIVRADFPTITHGRSMTDELMQVIQLLATEKF